MDSDNEIIGESRALRAVLATCARVARTEASVVITGETGTGKESIARRIHALSARSETTMVTVNAGAIPSGLVESELFGHEKGSFTNACEKHKGVFERANGGTLFLDEVAELSSASQVKLLRVLQEQRLTRVGGTHEIQVDVRVIAATNRSLESAVQEGAFREDLFYRLNVVPVEVPPLRDRIEDLPILVDHFLKRHAGRSGRPVCQVPSESLERLRRYGWPGNIRELSNVIERGVTVSDGKTLHLDPSFGSMLACSRSDGSWLLCDVERNHIVRVLDHTDWVISGPKGAARVLGLHPNTLRNRMKKLGILRKVSAAAA